MSQQERLEQLAEARAHLRRADEQLRRLVGELMNEPEDMEERQRRYALSVTGEAARHVRDAHAAIWRLSRRLGGPQATQGEEIEP